jgi:hypothetical protein
LTQPTSIGDGAFSFNSQLIAFTVDVNNKTYTSIDGALFSKDGRTLVAYPPGKKGQYSIPQGVAQIESGAFAGTQLTSVTIPANIDPNAFSSGLKTCYETNFKYAGTYTLQNGAWSRTGGPVLPAELTLGEGVIIIKIDGVSQVVQPGQSITLAPGVHTIVQHWGRGTKTTELKDNDPWEINLRSGKRYIITAREEGSRILFSIREQ